MIKHVLQSGWVKFTGETIERKRGNSCRILDCSLFLVAVCFTTVCLDEAKRITISAKPREGRKKFFPNPTTKIF